MTPFLSAVIIAVATIVIASIVYAALIVTRGHRQALSPSAKANLAGKVLVTTYFGIRWIFVGAFVVALVGVIVYRVVHG